MVAEGRQDGTEMTTTFQRKHPHKGPATPVYKQVTMPDRNQSHYPGHGMPEPLDRDFDEMWIGDDDLIRRPPADDDE